MERRIAIGPRERRLSLTLVGALAASLLVGGGGTATGATVPTVKVGRDYGNSRSIVVTGLNRAVYRRAGETRFRILCTGACLSKWPPVTVPSATTRLIKGPGVTGILSKFRRRDGRWQVTLRGYPLYRFSPDHNVGEARGQGADGVWFTLSP